LPQTGLASVPQKERWQGKFASEGENRCVWREAAVGYNQNGDHAEKILLRRPTASALKTQRAKRDRERSSPRPPKTPTIKILTSEKLAEIPWLLHGFSTRQAE